MSENDATRTSITATVNEIVQGHAALGLPVEEEEFLEAWAIIDRIERQLQAEKAKAWSERWSRA